MDARTRSRPLSPRTSSKTIEEIIREESPLAGHSNGHHVHPKPAPIVDVELSQLLRSQNSNSQGSSTPARSEDSAKGRGSTSTSKSSHEDEAEYQDVDDIERIGEHRDDDGVEHAAKLTHPDDGGDDDDSTMSGTEHVSFNKEDQKQVVDAKDKDARAGQSPSKQSGLMEGDKDVLEEAPPQNLNKAQYPIKTLQEQTPWSEKYDFPSWDECQEIKEKADGLPDLLHVPFEVSVKDVVLEGWEDEWISKARYTGPQLEEPKIDFVYNCEYLAAETTIFLY